MRVTKDADQFGEEVRLTRTNRGPGWYMTVTDDLDVFASGPGERASNGEPGGETWRCTVCGEAFDERPEGVCEGDDEGDEAERGPGHQLEPIPLAWANSAHITFDEADDAIHLSISVGDPRGRFVFTVRRWRNDEGKDALLIHTPYPGEGMPHMPLTELRPGTYEVGH